MTFRNETKKMFGKLRLNNEEIIDLGRATLPELSQRVTATIKSRIDLDVSSWQFFASESKDSLAKMLQGGVQAEYAHAGLDPNSPLYGFDKSVIDGMQMIDEDTMSPFEGITMNRLIVANTSPEFEAYRTFATSPDKRVGVESGLITAARDAWREAYPDVAVHIPPWKD